MHTISVRIQIESPGRQIEVTEERIYSNPITGLTEAADDAIRRITSALLAPTS